MYARFHGLSGALESYLDTQGVLSTQVSTPRLYKPKPTACLQERWTILNASWVFQQHAKYLGDEVALAIK
jgi:hypothetical protein